MLQGDIHRFYVKLRRHWPTPPTDQIQALDPVREIAEYYAQFSSVERHLLLCWAKKEESGIGMIPAALSGIPLIALIFAPLIQDVLSALEPWIWVAMWFTGALAFTLGIYVHQRQKAYTTLHVQILEHLCRIAPGDRQEKKSDVAPGLTPGAQ